MSEGSFEMSDDEPMAVAEVGGVVVASDPLVVESSDKESPDVEVQRDSPEEAKEEQQDLPAEDAEEAPVAQIEPQEAVQSSPQKRNPPKPKREGKPPVSLSALSAAALNPMTYDLDMMLDPRLQKKADERLSATTSGLNLDFVKMNKDSAGHPQGSRSRDEGPRSRASYQDPVNVEERFYKYRKTVEDKVKLMEEELRRKEKETCTFAPSIKSKHSASTDGTRSKEDFYKDMMRHKQEAEERIKQLREESDKAQKSQEDAFFRPQVCAKSKAILEAKGETELPVHEKLYKAHKQNMQRQMKSEGGPPSEPSQSSSEQSFKPVINKMSQNLVREKPIEQHLLEDAERRLKRLEAAPARPPSQKLLSSNSEQMLLKRFKEEFVNAWEALDEGKTGVLNYTKTAELLKQMHFIENETEGKRFEVERAMMKSMWTLMQLGDDGEVRRTNMETFLLALMNLPVGEAVSRAEAKSEAKPAEADGVTTDPGDTETKLEPTPGATRSQVENGVLHLTPGEAKRLHFQYKDWYDRRLATLKALKSAKEDDRYTFKPDLSKTAKKATEVLATRRPDSGKPEEHLLAELAKKQERQKEMQEKAEREMMKECVFHPKTDKRSAKLLAAAEEHKGQTLSSEYLKILKEKNPKPQDKTTALFNLAYVSQQKRRQLEKTPEEMDLEAQEIECTFVPDLKKTRNFVSGQGAFADPPKGVDKAIERMARARQEADEIKALRESGLSYRGKKEKKQAESKTEGPLVVLAVQVSGRAEELRVRPGDDLEALISAFAAQHRLNSTEATLVGEQLRNQYEQATGSASDD